MCRQDAGSTLPRTTQLTETSDTFLTIQMLFEAQVSSGRRVYLLEAHITETYEGLLEGSVSARVNEAVLRSRKTAQLWPEIPELILGLDAIKANLGKELPRFMFQGRFESEKPARNPRMMRSVLVLVWFQSELSPILSTANLALVNNLDWERLAQDFEIT
jgi:hypothetical protein